MAKIKRVVPETKAAAEKMSQGPAVIARPKRPAQKLPTLADGITGSDQQDAIWDRLLNDDCHLVVNAYAGTGKTFTMIRGLSILHTSGALPKYVNVAAFNRSVGKELQEKVPEGVRAGTLHAYGFSTCRYVNNSVKVEEDKMEMLLIDIMGEHLNKEQREIYYLVLKLASLCKNTLTGSVTNEGNSGWVWTFLNKEIDALCDKYEIVVGDRMKTYDLLLQVMNLGLAQQDVIDQDDMIWFPVVLDYRVFKVDLLVVDEVQDLNRCQHALIRKAGKRILVVGDRYQAIYGFRGADVKSFDNIIAMLNSTGRPVVQLPLSKTRRCPKSHVAYVVAKCPWLSEFEALPEAPMGSIETIPYEKIANDIQNGDMVVCRTNAPVVELAFSLLRLRKRVKIQGRNFGQDLRRIIEQRARGVNSIGDLKAALELWGQQQEAKLNKIKLATKREKALCQFRDKMMTLRFFVNNGDSIQGVLNLIDELFTESPGIRDFALLGTVHALKGMESNRVWVLGPEQMPHRMAKTEEEIEQEWNLWYVAHTRSKDKMFLTSLPSVERGDRFSEE